MFAYLQSSGHMYQCSQHVHIVANCLPQVRCSRGRHVVLFAYLWSSHQFPDASDHVRNIYSCDQEIAGRKSMTMCFCL